MNKTRNDAILQTISPVDGFSKINNFKEDEKNRYIKGRPS